MDLGLNGMIPPIKEILDEFDYMDIKRGKPAGTNIMNKIKI